MKIIINGRFLAHRATGVQWYAREIVRRLDGHAEVKSPLRGGRGLTGHFWEQQVLPGRLRGELLWSPCNTGPLKVRSRG